MTDLNSKTHIELADHGRLEDVTSLIETLCNSTSNPIELSVSRVKVLTTQTLQVLVAAKQQWDADDQPFVISGDTKAFHAGVVALGLPENFFDEKASL